MKDVQNFTAHLQEDRRLVLLRLLAEMPTYTANSSVLTMALASYGHAVTRDLVRTDLHWLQEQGLVIVGDLGPMLVATATERGQDVASGRAIVPGVKRPGA